MGNLITIIRGNEVLFECTGAWYVPRIGETIALAKWDTVYTVIDVFTVFGKGNDVETVKIRVEIFRG